MKTEKTLRHWLDQLEEPCRSQALKNVERENDLSIDVETSVSLSSAILETFVWNDSPEGQLYWSDKFHELREKGL